MPFEKSEEIEFKNRFEEEAYRVRKIKIALNRLGYYRPMEGEGITGEADSEFHEALNLFQKKYFHLQNNRDVFNERLEEKLIEAIEEKDFKSFAFTARYVWRTAGDDFFICLRLVNSTRRIWQTLIDEAEKRLRFGGKVGASK